MSLINQMLRDLESRPESDRSGNVRAVGSRRRSRLWLYGALALALVLGVGIAQVESFFQSAPAGADDGVAAGSGAAPVEEPATVPTETEPVQLVTIEQLTRQDGQRLRFTFSDNTDYRRLDASSDRLVIATPAEPAPDLDSRLPPAVSEIRHEPGRGETPPRLTLMLSGWQAGALVAEDATSDRNRLLLRLEPVPTASTETSGEQVADSGTPDSNQPETGVGEPERADTASAERSPDTTEADTDSADSAVTVTDTEVETQANGSTAEPARMSRERREPTPAEQAEEIWSSAREALRQGREREAEAALQRILAILPAHVPARTTLVELFLDQGRAGEADELLAEAATTEALAPADRAYFLRQRARLWMNADDLERAIALLEEADPDPAAAPESAALLAGLYYRSGRHASAVQWYEALLDNPPRRSAWWMGLGLAREGVGDFNGAVTAYRRALEGDGLRPSVRDYLSERIRELDGQS